MWQCIIIITKIDQCWHLNTCTQLKAKNLQSANFTAILLHAGLRRPSQRELLKHVKTTKWYKLGLELKLDEDDLAFIERDDKLDSAVALERVLKKWLEVCEKPTWWTVVNALREVGDRRKARDLQEKFCQL